MKKQRESKRRVVLILLEELTVRTVPFTTEKKVFWCLFCAATAFWAVHFVNLVKVGFVVAMSNLELVEGTGNLSLCAHWNDELLPGFLSELCKVCAWILEDGCWSSANESL
jgi:hypothetical protein